MNPPVETQRICFGETCTALEFTGEAMPQAGEASVSFANDVTLSTLRVYGLIEELGELANSEWPPSVPITSIEMSGNVIVVTGSTAWTQGIGINFELTFADDVVRDIAVSFT